MERTQVLELMGTLKLYGMRSAYDEVMATGIKRQHEPPRIVGDLLSAEIAEKQARSIKYQLTVAKLPLAKDIDDFDFADTPVNEALVRDLATGAFIADQRNAVLIGGTGTGKSHLAIAIARSLIRNGARGRFFNVVDLVNRLETEHRAGKQGRIADYLKRAPKGVVCLVSALAFHGLTDRLPRKVWLAIGQKDWAPKPDGSLIRIVRFTESLLTEGVETHVIEGVPVKVFSAAKTIADCFRHRSKIGQSVAIEGLQEALRQRKATPGEIARQAERGGVSTIIRPYLEALTANG